MKWYSFFKPFSFERACQKMFKKKTDLFTLAINFPPESRTQNLFWELEGQQKWTGNYKIQNQMSEIYIDLNNKRTFSLHKSALSNKQIQFLFWSFHQQIETKIEALKPLALAEVQGVTTQHLQDESRALVWLQTSLRVLKSALDKCEKDESLILQAFLKIGTQSDVFLRIVIFNLDIAFTFLPDQSLEIVIFDDKNQGHGKSQTPSLKSHIRSLKAPFLNEIIPVISRLMDIASSKLFSHV
jgi:hypothetical protein